MQVVNSNKAVASLGVSTDGGSTWQTTTRQDYNYFENSSGFGTTTVDVKVTSVDGDVVIINDVPVSAGVSQTASSNFGSSGTTVSSVAAVVSSSSISASSVEPTTTSTTPIAISTISESFVAASTSVAFVATTKTYPGANFQETSASLVAAPSTLVKTYSVPVVSSTSSDQAPATTEAPTSSCSTSALEAVTTVTVDACEA
jgi:hypothetical protein